MKSIDKLAWIKLGDGKILSTKTLGKDKYYIPGGKRESGETDEQALCREIKEELSVDVLTDTIRYFGVFEVQAHGHPIVTIVQMTCYTARYRGELQASSEIAEFVGLVIKTGTRSHPLICSYSIF